jgi:hypothetical protein
MEELAKLQVPAVAMDSQADYLEHVKTLGGAVVHPGRNVSIFSVFSVTKDRCFCIIIPRFSFYYYYN